VIMHVNHRLRFTALPLLTAGAVVAVLLTACSYRMDRVENPVQLPVAWDATLTPTANDGVQPDWWKSFGSPVLDQLIQEALKGNPGLIATEERLKQAERTLSGQHDGLFPDPSIRASTGRTRSGSSGNDNPLLNTSRTTDSTSASLSLSYNVDLWGATAARYRASVAQFIGTRYDTDLARIQLAANVSRDYFNLLSIRSRVDIARRNLQIAQEILRIVDAQYRNGVAREYDLRQQTVTVLQQQTQLIPLENQLRAAETALGLLLGQTPQDFHVEGEPIDQLNVPEISPWLPGDLLLRRPDMATAETTMAAAKANLAVAHASLIPVTLSLSASDSAGSQDLFKLTDVRNYSVQGLLSVATGIFDYRGRRNSYLNAKSNEYVALVNYANTIRTALKEVDDDLAAVDANRRAEASQQATLEQAQRALDLAQVQLREGSTDQQTLLNAQRTLFSAQDSLAQARLTRLTSAVTLYVALGGGWVKPENADTPSAVK
jgi:outer membrane protein, multidrug efflux system